METNQEPTPLATKGSSLEHAKLVDGVLLLLGALPVCRVWKNATGAVKTPTGFIKFGLKGSADILGITSDGLMLAIECKSGNAKLSKQQLAFRHMLDMMGGRYYVCRDAEDMYEVINSLKLPEVIW